MVMFYKHFIVSLICCLSENLFILIIVKLEIVIVIIYKCGYRFIYFYNINCEVVIRMPNVNFQY